VGRGSVGMVKCWAGGGLGARFTLYTYLTGLCHDLFNPNPVPDANPNPNPNANSNSIPNANSNPNDIPNPNPNAKC
jgi:hypothetical protein